MCLFVPDWFSVCVRVCVWYRGYDSGVLLVEMWLDDQHFLFTTSESATESSHTDTMDQETTVMSTHPRV